MGKYYQQTNWTEDLLSLLGTMSDAEIARKLGISRERVRQKRSERGIKKYSGLSVEARMKRDQASSLRFWTNEELSLLGTMSDEDVALKIGLNLQKVFIVSCMRNRLNIKSYKSKQGGE